MKNYAKAILVAVAMLGASVANASEATDAIAAIATEATSLTSAAWPVLTGLVVTFIGMKLFKKFAGKAT